MTLMPMLPILRVSPSFTDRSLSHCGVAMGNYLGSDLEAIALFPVRWSRWECYQSHTSPSILYSPTIWISWSALKLGSMITALRLLRLRRYTRSYPSYSILPVQKINPCFGLRFPINAHMIFKPYAIGSLMNAILDVEPLSEYGSLTYFDTLAPELLHGISHIRTLNARCQVHPPTFQSIYPSSRWVQS